MTTTATTTGRQGDQPRWPARRRQTLVWAFIAALFAVLAGLACLTGGAEEANRLNERAYWACATATPQPTQWVVIGWTTPDPTGPGEPTPTPEAVYGWTTPAPTQTPYYRVGTFHRGQTAYIAGLGFTLTGHESEAAERPGYRRHYFHFRATNYGPSAERTALSHWLFARTVVGLDGELVYGRWGHEEAVLRAGGFPSLLEREGEPLAPQEERAYTVGMTLPAGTVSFVGMGTDWERPVAGGVPIWFYLGEDGIPCPYGEAVTPPPPTPRVLGDYYGREGGGAYWPAQGYLTSPFGCRPTITGIISPNCPPGQEFHNGIDIANGTGTLIWSPVDGVVTYAGGATSGPNCAALPGSSPPHLGYGLYVRIEGDNGQTHILAHLQRIDVAVGETVTAGQVIGTMNSTGCSTGSHLHWGCYENGLPVDPHRC
jgi:murein DD-endopeptidase MepM/ murein hydrolase activator NlpD